MKRSWLFCGVALLMSSAALAEELNDLLQRGPVVLVETDAKGKFDRATAVNLVKRPVGEVWKLMIDFARYKDFMPKVLKSEVTPVAGTGQIDVKYEIDVPMSNTKYVFRYDIDPAAMTMHGAWLKGDIKGSFCDWKIVAQGDDTLLYYTTASRNFSSLAQALEDDQQTITVGVNVSAALAVVKAIKRRAENPPVPDAGGH